MPLLIVLSVLIVASTRATAVAQEGWQQYANHEHEFTLRYPADWVEAPSRPGIIVFLAGPKTAGPSGKPMRVWIVTPSFVSAGTSLDAWATILESVNGDIHRIRTFECLDVHRFPWIRFRP
jgi:hypothetical protein